MLPYKLINKRISKLIHNSLEICSDHLNDRRRIHFLHIGKTGGSAVKATLHGAVTDNFRIKLHKHSFHLNNIPAGEKCFFFVRDPVSRFISGFYCRKRMGRPLYNVPWSRKEAFAFTRFSTPEKLALSLSSNEKVLRNEGINAMNSIQHVRDSYWKWFVNEEYFKSRINDILYVGSQEFLCNDFSNLTNIIGLSVKVSLPDPDFVESHRSPNGLDKHLSERSINNLKRWYKEDYEFLDVLRGYFNNIPVYDY